MPLCCRGPEAGPGGSQGLCITSQGLLVESTDLPSCRLSPQEGAELLNLQPLLQTTRTTCLKVPSILGRELPPPPLPNARTGTTGPIPFCPCSQTLQLGLQQTLTKLTSSMQSPKGW